MNRKQYNKEKYDELLAEMVNNPSFFSDKDLAEAQQITNELLKMMLPAELHKEAEATIQDAVVDIKADFKEALARKKLEEESKARRVVIGGETDPMHLTNPDDPFKVTSDLVKVHLLPFALKKKRVEWKSEFGSRFEDGFSIELQDKTPNPVMTREEAIAFAKHILAVTRQDTYRGV